MTLLQPEDVTEHAQQHTRSFSAAEKRLKEASDAAMKKFLKRLRQETRSALTASSAVDPLRMNPQLFSVGAAKGWWQNILRLEMEDALLDVWRSGRAATSDAALSVGGLDAAGDFVSKTVDRLSRTATPTIPEQAFDTVRQALVEEMTQERSPKQMAERIAAELQWQGEDRGYWESRQRGAERRLNEYLDTNYGAKYIEDPLTGERRLNEQRDDARRNDPEADRIQQQISQASRRLDRDQSTWQARSERIARTETTAAYNAGVQSAYLDEGVGYKMWIAIGDARTRDTHIDAHGQCVLADGEFNVGADQLFFPGDPSGSPEEVINCRCTTIAADSCEGLREMVQEVEGPIEVPEAVTDEEIADLASDIFGTAPIELPDDDDDEEMGVISDYPGAHTTDPEGLTPEHLMPEPDPDPDEATVESVQDHSKETFDKHDEVDFELHTAYDNDLLTEEQKEDLQEGLDTADDLAREADKDLQDAWALAPDEETEGTPEEIEAQQVLSQAKLAEAEAKLNQADELINSVTTEMKEYLAADGVVTDPVAADGLTLKGTLDHSQATSKDVFQLNDALGEAFEDDALPTEQAEELFEKMEKANDLVMKSDDLTFEVEDLLAADEVTEEIQMQADLKLVSAEGALLEADQITKEVREELRQAAQPATLDPATRAENAPQMAALSDEGKITLTTGQDFANHIVLDSGSEYIDLESGPMRADTLEWTEKFDHHRDPRVDMTPNRFGEITGDHMPGGGDGSGIKPTSHKELANAFTDPTKQDYNSVDTVSEAAAHWSYVGNENIQQILRTGDIDPTNKGIVRGAATHNITPEEMAAAMKERAESAIIKLDEGISTSDDHGGFVGYRGSNLKYIEDHMGKDIADRMKGDRGYDPRSLIGMEYTDAGYTATSVDSDVAKNFYFQQLMEPDFEDTPPILYEVIVPDGVGALSVNGTSAGSSMFEEEQEMLLGREQKFRVVDVVSPYHDPTQQEMRDAGIFSDDIDDEGYDSVLDEQPTDMLANGSMPIIVRVEALP